MWTKYRGCSFGHLSNPVWWLYIAYERSVFADSINEFFQKFCQVMHFDPRTCLQRAQCSTTNPTYCEERMIRHSITVKLVTFAIVMLCVSHMNHCTTLLCDWLVYPCLKLQDFMSPSFVLFDVTDIIVFLLRRSSIWYRNAPEWQNRPIENLTRRWTFVHCRLPPCHKYFFETKLNIIH